MCSVLLNINCYCKHFSIDGLNLVYHFPQINRSVAVVLDSNILRFLAFILLLQFQSKQLETCYAAISYAIDAQNKSKT